MQATDQVLLVWGEFACFTRPELKVERFSYPFITPSAARGIYDAIFAKPARDPARAEFRWQVTRIELLSPPAYIALRRNEVKDKVSTANVQSWMAGRAKPEPIVADADRETAGTDQKGRTQRQTMALRDVRYRLHARIVPWPGFEDRIPALEAQFRRRASQGKCFYQPYLGCREFPAYFELADEAALQEPPIPWNADVGIMLYDVFDLSRPGTCDSAPAISVFHAKVCDGVVEVPDYDSPLVLKLDREELNAQPPG